MGMYTQSQEKCFKVLLGTLVCDGIAPVTKDEGEDKLHGPPGGLNLPSSDKGWPCIWFCGISFMILEYETTKWEKTGNQSHDKG